MKKLLVIALISMIVTNAAACAGKETPPPQEEAVNDVAASSKEDTAETEENREEESKDDAISGEWSASGAFIDENDENNHLLLYHAGVEEGYTEDSWTVTALFGEEIYGGFMEEKGASLTGPIISYDNDGNEKERIEITLTEEDGKVILAKDGSDRYTFITDDTDYSEMNGDVMPFFQYAIIHAYEETDSLLTAAYDYLAFDKMDDADPAHAVIPYVNIIATDDSDPSDVLVYGDYYLFEFEKDEDILRL